jgi:hypothetical protein
MSLTEAGSRFATNTFLAAVLLVAAAASQPALSADFDRFIGKFAGHVITEDGERDLTVEILEEKKGFRVNWSAHILREDGSERDRSYSIWFVKTDRAGIYRSAVKSNPFGGYVPLDPMLGEPYSWARIEGDAMTVYALVVRDDGGYDMLAYERRLTAEGMHLSFSRVRDGEVLRGIEADLERVQ